MVTALIALGSNLGEREALMRQALAAIAAEPASRVVAASSLYETRPVGGPPQPDYLNACLRLETEDDPAALLRRLLQIEQALGRVRSVRNAPRPIDLDLLLHGGVVVTTPELTVPHPRMCERAFVLVPAVEIAAELRHPAMKLPLRDVLERLGGPLQVRRWAPASAWTRGALPVASSAARADV